MIELRGVSKTVTSGGRPLTILQPLDLVVPSGQFIAVVGPSGSGKSTLLGLIAGLDEPSAGQILIDEVDITRLGEDDLARLRGRKIGFVFQSFHLIPSLTALENVLVPMEIAGRRDAAARAAALLEEVGLQGRGHHYPRAVQRPADRAGRRADRQSGHRQRPAYRRSAGHGQPDARHDDRARDA